MSRKKIIRYQITKEGYENEGISERGNQFWRNFELSFNKEEAMKIARDMGNGSEIEQISETRSGKRKVKVWIYNGEND